MMKILFWTSISVITYVYLGYPAIICLGSILFKKKVIKGNIFPTVSVLISAYNEEHNIEDKIKSLLAIDYPKDKMEVLIGSDGSTDKTKEAVSKYTNGTVKFYSFAERRGKPAVLNRLFSYAKGDILVFTDARQRLEKDSLKELVSNFYDERVGSVSAELLFESEDNKPGKGVGLYWKYEKLIRKAESEVESMLGATGAMYAVRREVFSELPANLILDDVYIPFLAIRKGYRAVFEPRARIYDRIVKDAKDEFSRKARTLAGNFQVFGFFKELFNPLKSPIAFQLFSHKFLRLVVPFFLAAVLISNIFILDSYLYGILFVAQLLFYSFAFIGYISKGANRLFDIPYIFCVMNLAAVAGLYRFLAKKQDILWHKAALSVGGAGQR